MIRTEGEGRLDRRRTEEVCFKREETHVGFALLDVMHPPDDHAAEEDGRAEEDLGSSGHGGWVGRVKGYESVEYGGEKG